MLHLLRDRQAGGTAVCAAGERSTEREADTQEMLIIENLPRKHKEAQETSSL